jgi:hypothetical protein
MHERGRGQMAWPSPISKVVRSLAAREGVAQAAQRPLLLAPLSVALPLCFLRFLLGLPRSGSLGGFFARLALPLLRPALGLLLLVAREGARGFLHPSLGLILQSSSFLMTFMTTLTVTSIAGNTNVRQRSRP